MNDIILHEEENITICLSLTSMRINAQYVREQFELIQGANGINRVELDILNVPIQEIDLRISKSCHTKKQDFSRIVNYVNQKQTTPIDFITGIIDYVKGVGKKT